MILVTGASGFVGRNLISKLVGEKYELCCILRESSDKKFIKYLKVNKIKVIICQLTDFNMLEKSLEKIKISSIIHLAGIIKSNSFKDYLDSNVKSTQNLLRIAKKNKINNFIFISSDLAGRKIMTEYGKSKHDAEIEIKKSEINYTILRPTVIYGKGDNKFIIELAGMVKKSRIIPVIGTGDYIFQPVFVNDIVEIIIKCLVLKKKKTYNACCDEAITLNEIIDMIADAMDKKVIKIHVPMLLLKPAVAFYEIIVPNPSLTTQQLRYFPLREKLDNSEIKKDLNFVFTGFKEGILKSI